MENSVLLKELAPKIEKSLSNKETIEKIKRCISSYLDNNSDKLTTAGPVYRTTFTDNEFNKFYTILEIDPNEVRTILKKSTYIKNQWQIMNNPFNSVAAFCIRYFKMKKINDMVNPMVIYLTLSMYPSLHYKYFEYEPNQQIMNYTINNLSNKYKVKTSGTIYHALIETTLLSDKTYTKDLIRATDKDITDYIQAYKTRMNSMIRKIANEFYDNEKAKKYMNEDSESSDEEDFRVADNDTLVVERYSDTTTLNLTVNGPNMQLINIAAKMSDISVNELRNTVNSILNDKVNREDVKKITSAIIFLFIFDSKGNKDKIGSNDFIVFSMEVYKRANTSDKNIVTIKGILDKWLEEYSVTYKKTQRIATINNFRKALFIFFVFSIQQHSK